MHWSAEYAAPNVGELVTKDKVKYVVINRVFSLSEDGTPVITLFLSKCHS